MSGSRRGPASALGSSGRDPEPRRGVLTKIRRASDGDAEEGVAGFGAMPHGGARRSRGALLGLRARAAGVQFVSQPALSEVPGVVTSALAGA